MRPLPEEPADADSSIPHEPPERRDQPPRADTTDPSAPTPEKEPPPRSTPALRVHLQGASLLIVLLLVLWAVLDWAGTVISSALSGHDGAIVAKALVESDDSSRDDTDDDPDEPLDGDEIAELQAALVRFGYEPGPVDGILGDLTRIAIEGAKADLGLPAASDRRLIETLHSAIAALDDAPNDPES